MSKKWVEMVPFSDTELAKGKLYCEISGKKSIIRSMLTGSISIRHVLNMLASASEKEYCFGPKPYVFDPSNIDAPPFIYVYNASPASDATNDFAQIMSCFDVNVLSFTITLAFE